MAHETGHSIGMEHTWDTDFHPNGCIRRVHGLPVIVRSDDLSGHRAFAWSPCSKEDFQAHYLQYKDSWCMEGKYWLFRIIKFDNKVMMFILI